MAKGRLKSTSGRIHGRRRSTRAARLDGSLTPRRALSHGTHGSAASGGVLVGAHVPSLGVGGGVPPRVVCPVPSAVSSVLSSVARLDESDGSCEREQDEDVLSVGTTNHPWL